MKVSEHQMQESFFDEIRILANSEPRLKWCHASMNGLNISPGQRNKANKAGLTKGVWDVFLPEPKGSYGCAAYGLYLEFKTKGNNLTKGQLDFRKDLRGYFDFVVCYSAEEGITAVKQYLNIGA